MAEDTIRHRIVSAFLRRLAEQKFQEIGLERIAAEAGLSLGDIRAEFDGKIGMLREFAREIDVAALSGWTLDASDETRRDRLFDAIMSRFDLLKEHRAALANLEASARHDPGLALCLNQIALGSARFLLAASGLGTGGLSGVARTQGLVFVLAETYRVWRDDADPDLSRTMAALDRSLEKAQTWSHRAEGVVGAACRAARRFGKHRPHRNKPADAATVEVSPAT